MGIDAEMLVRVRGEVTETDLRRAEHALFELFGSDLHSYEDRVLRLVDEYEQDGPTLRPGPGETFVRVALSSRYYGVDYERGDFRLIHDLAEALERVFPAGVVWYGGDSSGVVASPFRADEREELRAHWLEVAHRPYEEFFVMGRSPREWHPDCGRCAHPMLRNGFGGGPTAVRGDPSFWGKYRCACGEVVEVQGDVETRTTRREREERWWKLRNRAADLLEAEGVPKGEFVDLSLEFSR